MNDVDAKKYKVRKSGNSDVTTIPVEVKEKLNLKTGESIRYIFETDGSVKIVKAEEEVDVDSIVDAVMSQYEQAIKDLVDL
ncbi:addiction module antitoxin [Enterococcus asini]|uniref:Addiction module antitoxin n=1 Tax=Enterococcus asini TaxID=57732 RepID=A0AAW8TWW5_9ENTE|nr:addiction module antitoxin [Enterococcus asini]MDT2810194.1 addiction module antitoxin [Enterococcus asini]